MRTPRLFHLTWLLSVAAALVASEPAARAQAPIPRGASGAPAPSPSTPAPTITMPVVQSDPGVAFPQEAIDLGIEKVVTVPLLLSIDAEGAVTHAEVTAPQGHGFDDAALASAYKLRFEPAQRDGKAVAARIRFTYTFRPPPAAMSGRVLTLPGDRPIEGATVTVRDGAGGERTVTTGSDGAWRIPDLPAGAYHVTVAAPGRVTNESDEALKLAQETSLVDRLALPKPPPLALEGVDAGETIDVEVRGTQPPREVTKVTLSQRELNRIPGTGGDALKSLQNLPGVARPPAFLGLLIVRGSAPQDSQYFVDGTPIPIVYHFAGVYSVIPTEVIDKIDFFPGNFSSQYGRAMGGIVDVDLAAPKTDRVHALAEVDLIDARAVVQGPVFDTGWSFTLAARRSYVDLWLGPVLTATGANVSVAPVYYDYQALLERKLTSTSSVRFGFFGSDDRLAILLTTASSDNPTLAGSIGTHTAFWRGQALYRNRLSDSTEVRVVGAFGEDTVNFSAGDVYFNLDSFPITGRAEIKQKLDPHLAMNAGLDVIYSPYSVSARLPPLPRPGQPPPGPFSAQMPLQTNNHSSVYEPAAYVEWEATPWRGARIVPGLRLDYTKDTHSWDFDPRVVVRQDITNSPRTTLKAGAGIYSQPPQPQETNAVFGTPNLRSNRSVQYDVGVERQLTPQIEATLDTYYKQFDYLVVQGLGNTGSGEAFGAEVLLRYKPDEHFFGWIAYSLSRSLRRDAPGLPLRLFEYDETHVLNVIGSYVLGHGWEIGARFRLISGYMDTTEQYGYYDETVGAYNPLQAYPEYNLRLPLFHSLDIRVDKTWRFRWGSVGVYLDMWNVYNNQNVDGLNYNFSATKYSYVNDLPILPSLGVRVEL